MAVQNKRSGYRFSGYAEQNRSDVPGSRRNRQHSYQESKSIERLHVENKRQHEGERNGTSTRQDPDNEPDDDAEEEEEKVGKVNVCMKPEKNASSIARFTSLAALWKIHLSGPEAVCHSG